MRLVAAQSLGDSPVSGKGSHTGDGMSHYDGEIFQTLLQRDGLGSNIVVDILTAA